LQLNVLPVVVHSACESTAAAAWLSRSRSMHMLSTIGYARQQVHTLHHSATELSALTKAKFIVQPVT
jgi:L-asparagine transporter-like permease